MIIFLKLKTGTSQENKRFDFVGRVSKAHV